MKTKFILVLLLSVAMLVSASPLPITSATEPTIIGRTSLAFDVVPTLCKPACPGGAGVAGEVPYNLDMIDVEKVCQTGEDIYVAVLDTGLLYDYMDYLPEENIMWEWGKGYSYTDCYWNETDEGFWLDGFYDTRGPITMEPYGSGHGTHVASTIVGFNYVSSATGEEFWVRGVAPNVKIIPVLVLDTWVAYYPPGGFYTLVTGGTDEMVASGIEYIADLAEEQDIKIIISMSLGGPSPTAMIEDAIDYAIDKGCIVVVAAGNSRYEGMDWPGAYPQVISAAAGGWTMEWIGDGVATRWWLSDVPEKFWTEDDLGNKFQLYLTNFSSRPNPDLGQSTWDLDVCTPGAWIVGPYRPYGGNFGYYYVGGTSMATPHVSGIAALVLDKYPNLVQRQMEMILKLAGFANRMTKRLEERSATIVDPHTGELVTVTWGPFDYGTGFLQADSAMFSAFLFTRFMRRAPGCYWK